MFDCYFFTIKHNPIRLGRPYKVCEYASVYGHKVASPPFCLSFRQLFVRDKEETVADAAR